MVPGFAPSRVSVAAAKKKSDARSVSEGQPTATLPARRSIAELQKALMANPVAGPPPGQATNYS